MLCFLPIACYFTLSMPFPEYQTSWFKVRISACHTGWSPYHERGVGGDFIKGDGTGSFSIYGDKFPVRSLCCPSTCVILISAPTGRELNREARRARAPVYGTLSSVRRTSPLTLQTGQFGTRYKRLSSKLCDLSGTLKPR